MKDYYAILGVSSSATASEIKKAFRKLAIRYHPDKNPSASAKGHFQEINEAYDVLGDSVKRAAYDARLANPFDAAFAPAAAPPRQRDPAYRRSRTRAPRPRGPSAGYVLMRDSLKYVLWISKIALVFTTLFFIDYFLPYRQVNDYIQQVYAIGSRDSKPSYAILTGSGKELQVDDFDKSGFQRGRDIRLAVTLIFGSIMTVSNPEGTYRAWVSYMYSTHIFFPIILFVNSLLALRFRRRVEFCFNLNITASILLIINLSLM